MQDGPIPRVVWPLYPTIIFPYKITLKLLGMYVSAPRPSALAFVAFSIPQPSITKVSFHGAIPLVHMTPSHARIPRIISEASGPGGT